MSVMDKQQQIEQFRLKDFMSMTDNFFNDGFAKPVAYIWIMEHLLLFLYTPCQKLIVKLRTYTKLSK